MASKLAKTTSKSSHKKPKSPLASPPRRPVAIDKNPLGTDGFEFVEYAAPAVSVMGALFQKMGFTEVACHRSKDVKLYRQGDINFVLNHEPHSFAQSFARVHGPSVCAFAIRVKDAGYALQQAVALGAKCYHGRVGPMELNIPAIRGIGGSLIYLVDRYADRSIYDVDFVPESRSDGDFAGVGLTHIDHLTHNVHQGRMDLWAESYQRLFHFRDIHSSNLHS